MKTISLNKGQETIVDDNDQEWLSQWKWFANPSRNRLYARRLEYSRGKPKPIYMHRVIAGACKGDQVDHINRDTLDNRRENLRLCNQIQNAGNSLKRNGSSHYKGVFWQKNNQRWVAQICRNHKSIHLGSFLSEEEAALAYNHAALEHFGEFAVLNELGGEP